MQETPVYKPGIRKRIRRKRARQAMWSWIRELLIAIAIVLIVRTFLFSIITVKGTSMLETLQDGDRLYVSILTPRLTGYERGDIVICHYPGRNDQCVKRIVGLPGETIRIQDGTVYINGEMLPENYLDHTASYSYPETTLADDEYFVLGDNRPVSHDSHSEDVGPVTRMVGKVRCILWPFNRWGGVE